MSRDTETRERQIVTVATLTFEDFSLLNSSPTEDFTAGNREPQKIQGHGRTSLYHFIQCSASPALSPTALPDNPHLQWSDSLGTQ